ncbi:MAG: 3-methyladenine DNA glycosylase [Actinomycetales bacterium]|nr:3-methyladenine DNA glycosylase [Actinomycetales bacterium]
MVEMSEDQWRARASSHEARVAPWVNNRLERRARGARHAVYDFLFDYYPYSPSKLKNWHPGFGVILQGAASAAPYAQSPYRKVPGGVTADITWLKPRIPRLNLSIRLLEGIISRSPVTGCFALHEWAMVYGLDHTQVRHPYLPLRVTPDTVRDTVETVGLRCTHIDAYRFYTDQAKPLNATVPTRATQPEEDQPGCLHVAMDTYKLAGWFSPLISSDLIADAFELAAQAREIDMRASPYDVTQFGFQAIPVETVDGRKQYVREQAEITQRSVPVRAALLVALKELHSAYYQTA